MSVRHTVIGLPHPRAGWPAELARSSTSGAAPIDFLTCLSADEVRAVLASGRRVSAVLVDGASPQLTPALLADVAAAGAQAIGVDSPAGRADWGALGVASVLPAAFSLDDLRAPLARVGAAAGDHGGGQPARHAAMAGTHVAGTGRTIAVSGPGGAGATCVAMALAQGLAADGTTGSVLLVDGARRGDMAMYHDVGDVLPGLPEVLDAFEREVLDPTELDRFVFRPARGYDLLLGPRRAADGHDRSPGLVATALHAAARRWDALVVDHDGDLDDGPDGARGPLRARHAVPLALASTAELWLVVTGDGIKGLHDAVRRIDEAVGAGMPPERIQVVVNRAGRSPAARSSAAAALARLTAGVGGTAGPPVFLGRHARLAGVHRDAVALPRRLAAPVTSTVLRLLGRLGARNTAPDALPEPVGATTPAGARP